MKQYFIATSAGALALALAACGGVGDSPIDAGPDAAEPDVPPDASPDAPPDPEPLGPVAGAANDRFLVGGGVEVVPRELTETIEALVPQPDGTYQVLPATITGVGTFEIADVPEGPYALRVGTRYIFTEARSVELGQTFAGRPTQTRITSSPTDLTFDVSDMAPFQAGDILELYAPNAGAAFSSIERFSAPPEGATTLDITADITRGELPFEIDDAAGDTAFLIHVVADVTPEGVPYTGLREIANAAPFTLLDGESATFAGLFKPIPQTQTRVIDWDPAALSSLTDELVPGDADFKSSAIDGTSNLFGDPASRYSIPVLYTLNASLTDDVGPATVTFGDPFPPEATESVRWTVFGLHQAEIDGIATFTFGRIFAFGPADSVLNGPLAPTVGVPQNLRVDGRDALVDDLTGVSVTPTITWDAPRFGTPDSYTVFVVHMARNGNSFRRVTVASVFVDGAVTEVTLPPGLLTSGEHYFLQVRSEAHGDTPLIDRVFRGMESLSSMETSSLILTP